MSLLNRRKMIRTHSADGKQEMASDGRTVWVNIEEVCSARFCPQSYEFVEVFFDDHGLRYEPSSVACNSNGPTQSDWDDFVEGVRVRWGITVGSEHKPPYIGISNEEQGQVPSTAQV
jgi:hypothetical protein